MYLQGGMNLKANSWLTLAPSVLFRSTPDVPSVLDLNLVATVSDAYTLGLGYRTGSSFVLHHPMPNQQPISHWLHARLHRHGHPHLRRWHPRNRAGLGLEPTCQRSHALGHVNRPTTVEMQKKGKPLGLPFFVLRLENQRNATPKYCALLPNSSSMRSNWLYFAMRSERLAEPVLIWPVFKATAKSAMVVSSVSPLRWLITEV